MTGLWTFLKTDGGKAALAVSGLVLGLVYFLSNRRPKKFIYQTVAKTRVLTVKEQLTGRVEILFDGLPVQEVGLVQLKFKNVGKETIKSSDFVRPIKIQAFEGQKIIDADIAEMEPPGLAATLRRDENSVTIEPLLLNAQDSFQIKLLVANFAGSLSVDSRIEGVELKPRRQVGATEQLAIQIGLSAVIWGLLIFLDRSGLGPRLFRATLLGVILGFAVIQLSKYFHYPADSPDDYK
jgi:hypothetical protein